MPSVLPDLRGRLGAALFLRVAGPDGPRHARTDPFPRRSALVRGRQPDHPGPRRRVDVRRRAAGPAAADAAPGRDARGLGALRLPRRHVGPPAPHQHLPGGHDVRGRGRRGAGGRRGPRGSTSGSPAPCPTGRRTPPPTRTCSPGCTRPRRTASCARTRSTVAGRSTRPGGTSTSPRSPRSARGWGCSTRRRRRPALAEVLAAYRPELRGTPEAREAVALRAAQAAAAAGRAAAVRRARGGRHRADARLDPAAAAAALPTGLRAHDGAGAGRAGHRDDPVGDVRRAEASGDRHVGRRTSRPSSR